MQCSFTSCSKLSYHQILLAQPLAFSAFSFINAMTRALIFSCWIQVSSEWIGRNYRPGSISNRLNSKCYSEIIVFEHLVTRWWICLVWIQWFRLAGANISHAMGSQTKSLGLAVFLITNHCLSSFHSSAWLYLAIWSFSLLFQSFRLEMLPR